MSANTNIESVRGISLGNEGHADNGEDEQRAEHIARGVGQPVHKPEVRRHQRVLHDLAPNGKQHGRREQQINAQQRAHEVDQHVAGAQTLDDIAFCAAAELVVCDGAWRE